MRKPLKFFFCLAFFCLLSAALPFLYGQEQEDSMLLFYWSFLKCNRDGQIDMLNPEIKIDFPEHNLYKIFLQPEQNVFIYLYHYSNEKELTLLFPSADFFFMQNYTLGQGYFIPEAGQWFGLAAREQATARVEKFYLLAFVNRQEELELATREYLVAMKAEHQSRDLQNLKKQQVLNQIISFKNADSQFKTFTEKPVIMTTHYRGAEDELENLAIQVEAEFFYAKTIRLEY